MTIKDIHQQILSSLNNFYPEMEVKNFSYLILNSIFNYSRYQIHENFEKPVNESQYAKIKNIVEELKIYKPIQYIFKKTEFYNCMLSVTEDVLIPRPETEELVDWIIQDQPKEGSYILDIGTGSGCIAISLAKNLPHSRVSAMDISQKAIKIASSNAVENSTEINLFHGDIFNLSKEIKTNHFDIIVSNPPYVRESEKALMKPNVLDWEPEISLFVPDENPLIFYKEIIRMASKSLISNGQIFLEINEVFPEEIKNILTKYKFTSIEIRKDISGKSRMVKAVKK